ncbi:MAG TPA: PLP-dependent aminotransferase family protein, partial [Acidothermaceae bacterium]|nr:PLP-dependent aminotransferase family protein [Acidothermaceae bacterium]
MEISGGSRLDPYVDRYAERTHGMTTSEIRALFAVANRPEIISMGGGSPFVSALPLDAIGEMTAKLVAEHGAQALQYMGGQGDPRLRELICGVMALEGISASPDDVVVTVGSQQALDVVSRIFLDPGDVVIAEAPSYVGALGTFTQYQADVVHVQMDDAGLVPDALREAIAQVAASGRRAKFLYTVPNYHNPAGITLVEERRDEIIAICAEADLLILEDNP